MSNREIRQIKGLELRVATNANGQRTLSGYSAVFSSLSVDMGGWFELISPSAFTRTLQENPDVLCLYSHDTSLVLGRTKSSTLSLSIDQTGLRFECILPDTSTANDLIVSIERGDVDGCSFGFVCQSDVWSEDSEDRIVRTLLDVDLYEVTITAAPAYQATSVALRSAPTEIRSRITESRSPGCVCPCPGCVAGDCLDCSDADCDEDNCEHRDDSDDIEIDSRSLLWHLEMRLKLALARLK
ncbi:HK97 family phage prohead protease [Granulicella sp. dw_53]|uniref:HK97 family phage prohead protease n=1 Tax=Granulicella sp. dw_53 TaxID=2719792 RepID=UPI001BD66FE2|nr:HK97 family phage prohead protease [Granulicella sp. dw_53]